MNKKEEIGKHIGKVWIFLKFYIDSKIVKITNKVEQGRKGTGSREILKKSGKKIFFYSIKKETENSKFTKDFHSCYSMRITQFEK